MNKKLKKMLATISAVAVCSVSVVSTCAGAIALDYDRTAVTPYTTSFNVAGVKYSLWEEATDYFDNEDLKIYISDGSNGYDVLGSYHDVYYRVYTNEWCDVCSVCPLLFGAYQFDNEDDVAVFENYLSDNDIEYTSEDGTFHSDGEKYNYTTVAPKFMATDLYDRMQMLIDIKEDTGYKCGWAMQELAVSVTDIENELPEPTLLGDADCNDSVNISDAVLVMQSIVNPDKYKLSEQGKANADIDGNGITISDAIAIQEIAATHEYD